ncbi:MAG TPA: UDP-N-acetylmuramoyl-L-alanine--D-glutamate ligase [Dissulfurispiraceae bacterium]|nr:UDP-N-acetylmuramoyl-L-alanine--D-glutamate ligase [Dissulfurispiraceae bacterium]
METAYSGQRITVVGLARSGVGAANLLAHSGASTTVTDLKKPEQLAPFIEALDPAVSLALGGHPAGLLESSDLVVVSPGIPLDIEPLERARLNGVKIIGELELAYQALRRNIGASAPEFLAVTGTNGKSTTTALLDEMLRSGGISTILGGNIGNSLAAEVLDLIVNPRAAAIKYVVSELSSFQLEAIESFRPKGAAILNITPDHLDRYHEMGPYMSAKCRVSLNQSSIDYLVLNADDPYTPELERIIGAHDQKPQIFYFSRKKEVEGAYLQNGKIRFNLSARRMSSISPDMAVPDASLALDPYAFVIKGVHNIENAMAAALMAGLAGCSFSGIENALAAFPGLEHRLEMVRELNGVKYINDSKGTNVGAVLKSLEGFAEPVILIAGGRDKDSDFSLLRPLIKEKVKSLVLVGEAAGKIAKAVCDVTQCEMAGYDFRVAISKAKEAALPGDVVLLSPACASFDMFRDFEDRGRQFKQMVMEL